jgi:hypothetical protein
VLSAELVDANGKRENSWNVWVFPKNFSSEGPQKIRSRGFDQLRTLYPWTRELISAPTPGDTDLLVAARLDADTLNYLKAGGRVILVDPEPSFAGRKNELPPLIVGWRRTVRNRF